MALDVAVRLSNMTLQVPDGGAKGIAYGDIDILVRLIMIFCPGIETLICTS